MPHLTGLYLTQQSNEGVKGLAQEQLWARARTTLVFGRRSITSNCVARRLNTSVYSEDKRNHPGKRFFVEVSLGTDLQSSWLLHVFWRGSERLVVACATQLATLRRHPGVVLKNIRRPGVPDRLREAGSLFQVPRCRAPRVAPVSRRGVNDCASPGDRFEGYRVITAAGPASRAAS